MQFLVIAYDGKDAAAASRRAAARPAHLEGANHLNKAGNIIIGGAILNENNEMIGSTLCVDFNTRKDLDEWRVARYYSSAYSSCYYAFLNQKQTVFSGRYYGYPENL